MARRIMSWNKFHCKNRCDSAKKKKESRLAKSGAQTMAQAESIYAEQNRAVVPMSLLFGRGALCVHYVAFVLTIFVTTRHWINQCAHSSGPWGDSHTVRWILCVCTKISQSREKGNQKKKMSSQATLSGTVRVASRTHSHRFCCQWQSPARGLMNKMWNFK